MVSKYSKNLVYSVSLLSLIACASTAYAEDEIKPAEHERDLVVVTAQRQSSNLQKTPLAISVVYGDTIDKTNASRLTDLSSIAPGLTVTKSGGRETVPTVRGIGSSTPENTGSTGPGVSVYVDGVYVGDSVSSGQGLFDVNRLEVLRGPQGALYGVSSIGGSLILVSNQPKLGIKSGELEGSIGDYDYTRARLSYNLPIGDDLAFRIAAQKLDHEGYTKNTLDPSYDLDDEHTLDTKAALLWKPIDNFSATLTGQIFRQDNNGAAQKWIFDPNKDARKLTQDFRPHNDLDSDFYHLNMKWEGDWFDVNSITAYKTYDSKLAFNATFSARSLFPTYDYTPTWDHKEKSTSQEFNIISKPDAKIQWIAGLFYMRRTGDTYVVEYRGTDINDAMPPFVDTNLPASSLPFNLVYGNETSSVRKVISPFAQATIPLSQKLNVTIGARYNFERKENFSHNFSTYSNNSSTKTDETKVPTWRLETNYQLSDANMVYASFSTGYKAGGLNGNAGGYRITSTFETEKNKAFEIGSKNYFFDKTLRANFAAYFYDYRNMQYIQTDPIPFNQGMSNIPKIEIYGAEAELNYISTDRKLRANAAISLSHGEVKGETFVLYPNIVTAAYGNSACAWGGEYWNPACWAAVTAAAVNIDGNTPPQMPKVSISADISYNFNLANGVLTPRLAAIYRSSQQARIFNEAGIDDIKGYNLVNFDLAYIPADSNFSYSLTISNLFDKDVVNSRYTSPYESGQTSLEYAAPRQIVATIGYKF